MTVLETKRLVLRSLRMEDHAAIQKYFPEWEVVKYLTNLVPWPYPPDGARQFLETVAFPAIARGDDVFFGITEKGGSDEVIGIVHLRRKETESGGRGFWLGLPWHGKGYMTEAVRAVNDYAFDVLGMERLIVKNAKDNTASRRVKEKTGAVLLRTEPADHYLGGFTEQEVWELTAESWRRARDGKGAA